MEKCSCWHCGTCWGTREREECTCNGDPAKCDFYPEKRKGKKTMNTAEMWLKAQEDGCCYETTYKGEDNITLYYQKNKGFFDYDQYPPCKPYMWENFDELMNKQWRLRTMTKSEAEAKFNIKIVED